MSNSSDVSQSSSGSIIGAILADRYRIVEAIGAGGAGNVYRAVQIQLNRDVAVKLVRTDVDELTRKELGVRFRREAALAARLSHPNIVTVHDFGTTEDGLQYVVMSLLKGRTLKAVMRLGPMDAHEAVRIGTALAHGLRHAHSRGLIHRDVKPTNVLLVEDDDGLEQPKLLDFGLVKSTDTDLEMTGQSAYLGTPLYMSPEQVQRSQTVDSRSDIYSLGCMLYGMISGVMPYRGDGAVATALMHVNQPYPPMVKQAPDVEVDRELEHIVRRCLEKNPEDRFQDAGELAGALEAWQIGADASGSEPNESQWKWLLPFGGIAGLMGTMGLSVLLLVLVFGVAVMAWMGADEQVIAAAPEATSDSDSVPEVGAEDIVLSGEPIVEDNTTALDKTPKTVAKKKEPLRSPDSVETRPSEPKEPVESTSKSPGTKSEGENRTHPSEENPTDSSERTTSTEEGYTVDGVVFGPVNADRALTFVNTATWAELRAAGVYARGCSIITSNRPFASLKSLGETSGIGPKTLESISSHASAMTEP